MKPLAQALDEYLQLRRGLGFKLLHAGYWLPAFVRFLDDHGASHITTKLALLWVNQPVDIQPATRAARLGVVRRFATPMP